MKTFLIISVGRLLSLSASTLVNFALGVWVYTRTGSVTRFALILLFATVPSLVLSPVAGALIDRWNRRTALLLSEVGSMVTTVVLAALLLAGRLDIWQIYALVGLSSAFTAFQWTAYAAATSQLVERRHLGRAGGVTQFADSAAQMLGPLVGGQLIVLWDIGSVVLVGAGCLVAAVTSLLVVRIPTLEQAAAGTRRRLGTEIREGWSYIVGRSGLLGLLLFFSLTNFLLGIASVAVTPLVLSFSTPDVLGRILAIGGGGMIAGSTVMSVWGGPARRILGLIGGGAVSGLGLIIAGVRPSALGIAVGIFLVLFSVPFMTASSQAIWQSKVDLHLQGRVFAIRRLLARASHPLAYLLAGPLADRVFGPLMLPERPLATTLGAWLGVGPGRGIGLLFVTLGMLVIVVMGLCSLYPRLRRVERELPDVLTGTARAQP